MVLASVSINLLRISACALLAFPAVSKAQTVLSANLSVNQSGQVQTYLIQSAQLPNRMPTPTPTDTQTALNSAVMQTMDSLSPSQLAQTTAAPADPSVTPAVGSDNDVATVAALKPKSKGMLAVLDPGAPESTGGLTYGLSAGQGVAPVVPVSASFDHETALAVVAAFKTPADNTADSAASYAATPVTDPDTEERIGLVRAVYRVDGTEELVRHFIGTQHMRLIIGEVARHIDFSKLSDTDKYRLAAIAAVAQTELEDKIIRMNALVQAQTLTKPELLQLLAAYDIDAERKLTDLRLHDDGKVDRAAELDIRLAQYQIVKAFESGQ